MDKDEWETFLTIHIREGAWQVVLLLIDEFPKHERPLGWYREVWDENEDEEKEMCYTPLYSSTSGILKAWPEKDDPGLITLCKAITNRDWKVTRLILSGRRISDEGLKKLSTALTQSELYSLTLDSIIFQSQGLKHLCEALISSDCNLTSLNVGENWFGDEGIMHFCNALTSVNCTLNSLNISWNDFGDVGIMYLSHALTSINCTLTSLNVSGNWLGDKEIMHLCDALTSVNCTLTSLNVSCSDFGDLGMMHLCNVLTSVKCTLTSLNVSDNRLGDEGIVHLCKALTDTNCKLQSLNLRGNRNITDVGKQCLFEAITGTDWEVREGLILCRSIKSEA